MRYFLHNSTGNTIGIEPYLALYEIDDEGEFFRSIEINANFALKYSRMYPADTYGQLPEGVWDDVEAAKPEFGSVSPITSQVFESAWSSIKAKNADSPSPKA